MSAKIIIDFILTAVGAYMIFIGINMKKTGQISSLLVSENELPHCKDQNAYILYIYRKIAVFGLVSLLAGFFYLVNDMVYQLETWLQVLGGIIFLGFFLWFIRSMQIARAKFF